MSAFFCENPNCPLHFGIGDGKFTPPEGMNQVSIDYQHEFIEQASLSGLVKVPVVTHPWNMESIYVDSMHIKMGSHGIEMGGKYISRKQVVAFAGGTQISGWFCDVCAGVAEMFIDMTSENPFAEAPQVVQVHDSFSFTGDLTQSQIDALSKVIEQAQGASPPVKSDISVGLKIEDGKIFHVDEDGNKEMIGVLSKTPNVPTDAHKPTDEDFADFGGPAAGEVTMTLDAPQGLKDLLGIEKVKYIDIMGGDEEQDTPHDAHDKYGVKAEPTFETTLTDFFKEALKAEPTFKTTLTDFFKEALNVGTEEIDDPEFKPQGNPFASMVNVEKESSHLSDHAKKVQSAFKHLKADAMQSLSEQLTTANDSAEAFTKAVNFAFSKVQLKPPTHKAYELLDQVEAAMKELAFKLQVSPFTAMIIISDARQKAFSKFCKEQGGVKLTSGMAKGSLFSGLLYDPEPVLEPINPKEEILPKPKHTKAPPKSQQKIAGKMKK